MLKELYRKIKQGRYGFTLIELLIALAITGLLATGISASISQVIGVNASSTARMQAIKQLELAIDRIRLDVQMAQNVYTNDPDPSPIPNVFLTLKWVDWDSNPYSIKYSWDSTTNQLNRLPSEGTLNSVAKNIDSMPTVTLPNSNYLRIRISSTVGDYKPATETRVFEVKRRSGP
jgi:prepilin-type N-terminal cleavage/methylation domain-containing protein